MKPSKMVQWVILISLNYNNLLTLNCDCSLNNSIRELLLYGKTGIKSL